MCVFVLNSHGATQQHVRMRLPFTEDGISVHEATQQVKKIVRGTYDADIQAVFVQHALELLVSYAQKVKFSHSKKEYY
jgi:hypothetical protein